MTAAKLAYQIENGSDFKSWCLMQPNAYQLLKETIYRWRGSTIRTPELPGWWAVYRREQWQSWARFTQKQFKTAFAHLCIDGIVTKCQHRFNGEKAPFTFIQPTRKVTLPPLPDPV